MKDKYTYITINNRISEMLEFLKNKIPIVLDMEKGDLKYDTRSMYYKIYKYIYDREVK